MKAFRFPLERALEVRRMQLELEQARLERIQQEFSRVSAAESSLQKFGTATRQWIADSTPLESTTISTMNDFQRQAKTLMLRMEHQKAEIATKSTTQQVKVVDFQRRVKLLEKLRGRRLHAWETAVQKDQESFAADAFLTRWSNQH